MQRINRFFPTLGHWPFRLCLLFLCALAAYPLHAIDVGNASTPVFTDIDGDGDQDVFIGEQEGNINSFLNLGTARIPGFEAQIGTVNPFDGVDIGSNSRPVFVDLDNDADLDAVIGKSDGTIGYYENAGTQINPVFEVRADILNPFNGIDTGYASIPAFADFDSDGDFDAVIGERYGIVRFFENTGTAAGPVFQEKTSVDNPFDRVDAGDYSVPALVDIDDDGDLDAFIGENTGTTLYYENSGTADSPRFMQSIDVGGLSTPVFADIDNDGVRDLFIGEQEGNINFFRNLGTPDMPDFVARTSGANPLDGVDIGTDSRPVFVDMDDDADLDAVIGKYDGTIGYYENTGTLSNSVFEVRADILNPFNGINTGYASIPTFADFDSDGDFDAVIGERYGTVRFFENTGTAAGPVFQEKTSVDNPF
ncbi:MAG: hypothetical protein GY862_20185, partial [Gammaproteobacteria bacterium]|nr:hypothetical protein [Gammaproteobacteria bacterium]